MVIASLAVKKVHIIRLKDLRGEKVWIAACSLIARWMLSRFAAVKISGAWRLVTRSVLLGGVGWESGGRSERSMERFGEWRLVGDGEAAEDCGGVEMSIVNAAMSGCRLLLVHRDVVMEW